MKQVRGWWQRALTVLTLSVMTLVLGQRHGAAQDNEDQVWLQARSTGTTEAFQGYLDQFPTGRHAAEAFAGIVLNARGIGIRGDLNIEPAAGPTSATPAMY